VSGERRSWEGAGVVVVVIIVEGALVPTFKVFLEFSVSVRSPERALVRRV
jgi:hypothetical protein